MDLKNIDGYATKYGQYSTKIGLDVKPYCLEISGSYGGKIGTFEYIKNLSYNDLLKIQIKINNIPKKNLKFNILSNLFYNFALHVEAILKIKFIYE